MRYDVDTEALRASVTTVEEVLAQVRALPIAQDLRPVASAIPGGRAASSLNQVAVSWQARLAGTGWELRTLGQAVAAAADGYEAVERSAVNAVARPVARSTGAAMDDVAMDGAARNGMASNDAALNDAALNGAPGPGARGRGDDGSASIETGPVP